MPLVYDKIRQTDTRKGILMKPILKTVSLLLALLVILPVFAACSSNSAEGAPANDVVSPDPSADL